MDVVTSVPGGGDRRRPPARRSAGTARLARRDVRSPEHAAVHAPLLTDVARSTRRTFVHGPWPERAHRRWERERERQRMASSPGCLTAGGRAELSPPGTVEHLAAGGTGAAGEARGASMVSEAGCLTYRYAIVTQRGFVGVVVVASAAGLEASGGTEGHGSGGNGRRHQGAFFSAAPALPVGLVGWPGRPGRCCGR